MGRSKSELFLDRILAAAAPLFDELVAVQQPRGEVLSIRTIFDDGGGAPLFGVARALEDAGERAFILAVDYPMITTALLRDFRSRVETSAAPVVAPVWRGIPQPLCAGYDPAVIPLIHRRVEQRKLDLLGLMEEAAAETFVYDGPELLNVNTPAELEEAEKRR